MLKLRAKFASIKSFLSSECGAVYSEYLFIALLVFLLLIIGVTRLGVDVVAFLTIDDLVNAWN
jgi:Flp pilus assembly pilin Flp